MGWPIYRKQRPVVIVTAGFWLLAGCATAPLEQLSASEFDIGSDTTLRSYGPLTQSDRATAWRVRQTALETRKSGEAERWRSTTTNMQGSVTPTRTWKTGVGVFCREFEERVGISTADQELTTATACRDDEGRWLSVIEPDNQT